MIFKNKVKSILSSVLAFTLLLSSAPVMTTFAAQSNEYTDPADVWISANARTNELDMNATTTYETQFCTVCNRDTLTLTYRVPEYTRTGETALNRGVRYSDGTCIDGESKGNLDDGTPGEDSYYTGYHFTKSVCQVCGTFNAVNGEDAYDFNRNVYGLYSCDSNFFLDFDNTTYTPYNETHHTTTLKKGQYCQFCKGTFSRASQKQEKHNFTESVDAQLGNNRFYVTEKCDDCGYVANEYVTAKSVISSYYGNVDGEPHTLEVNDLSDSGVKTSIRYGNSADNCTLTSAPNYTQAGYNTVYYKITYSYAGESMTENGVSYVWLLDEPETNITIIMPEPEKKSEKHEHEFKYLETVPASCDSLGYERWQCSGCGTLEKRNYTPATGHNYKAITIKDANCKQNGLKLFVCENCGDFYEETTPIGEHHYHTKTVNPTCQSVGYTEHTCEMCGDKYITDITPLISHSYERVTKQPTCTDKGYTTSTCTMCGFNYVSDYTDAKGHEWDDGHIVTNSTCNGEGVIEYTCKHCDEKMIKATTATGHIPGKAATCTQPQICEKCGTVLALPKGHSYNSKVVPPTCTEMGYTVYECHDCGDTYTGDFTDKAPHHYHTEITPPTCTQMGYTTYTCVGCGDTYIADYTDKLPHRYETVVTNPTCTEMGFTTYKCLDCGDTFVSDYTDKTEHNYTKKVIEPTCSEHGYTIYSCPDCGKEFIADYTDCDTHEYKETVTPPTCTEMGYTTYTCSKCDESYIGSYTDKIPHDYEKTVVKPTCTSLGYTIYKCKNCDDTYTSDYVDKAEHRYFKKVIKPTCTDMGYTVYKCLDCKDTYKADYTDPIPHNYEKKVVEPSCTEFGHTEYNCKECGHSYVSDYTDKLMHDYEKTVTEPTCTELGYTVYKCKNCDSTYTSDYVDKAEHKYNKTVTEPTCTEMGYTTYKCENCDKEFTADFTDIVSHEFESEVTEPTCTALGYTTFTCKNCTYSYKGEYKEPLGHKPSEWIIDEPATIEHGGQKHIECTECGSAMQTADIAQLIDTDRTDEDGNAKIGNYSVIITDKNNIPVFNSEIVIDVNDKISVNLPSGRLLDYDDRTTVTVFFTETQTAAENITVYIRDENGNSATDVTNADGQIVFPNGRTNTGDEGGTIGGDISDEKETFVITVTDKTNITIPNCDVYIGESNNIVVKLPDGLILTQDSPAIITVTNQHGEPQKGFSVIVIADKDYIEKGITDMFGKLTVPPVNSGYTDKDGKVKVLEYNVFVNDENGNIENAFVTLNEDNTISVVLPAESLIDYSNRITVTVLDENGNGVKDMSVTVSDVAENERNGITDESGKTVLPPVNEDITDKDGKATVNEYNIVVEDESGVIENAFVENKDGSVTVTLPDGKKIDIDNRITVIVTDGEDKGVKDIPVTVKDSENSASNLTDESGKSTVPPTNIDYTDVNGYGELDGYSVTVKSETGAVEKAYIELDRTSGNITVTLPEGIKVDDYNNRVTISVENKADNTPVPDINIVIKETVSEGEAKITDGKTDKNGHLTVPPLSEDITDNEGKSDVTEEKTKEGEDTDGDGTKDTPDETVTTSYTVTVEDTKGIIENAFVEIKDGKIYVTLPDENTLTTSNQTTVTVLDRESKPVKGVNVTVTDKTKTTATKDTDANGKITVPVKSSSGGGGSSRSSGGGGGSISTNTVNIKITDKDGKAVTGFSKSTDTNGKITITLPTGKNLGEDDYYTVTATDSKGAAKADTSVTLKDKSGNTATGTTDKNGVVILPSENHSAYIFGYEDGTFRPDSNMSRAEAAAIFARLVSEKKGEKVNGKSSFKDVANGEWYSAYVGYLENYDIIKGYEDNTFRPEDSVSRAEFVSMAVRFYKLFDTVTYPANTTKYADITSSHWAVRDISYATSVKWLNGYADGSFKPDAYITRAEVVTVTNRATGRNADESYINKNLSVLEKFTDLKNNSHWAFYDIEEAANTHKAVNNSDGEVWSK